MACLLNREITDYGGGIVSNVSKLDISLYLQGSDMNTTGAVTIEERRLKVTGPWKLHSALLLHHILLKIM